MTALAILLVAAIAFLGTFVRRRRRRAVRGELLVERHAELPADAVARALQRRP